MGGVSSTFEKVPSCYGGGGGADSLTAACCPAAMETVDRSHLMNHPLHRSHTAVAGLHGHFPCPATFTPSSSHRHTVTRTDPVGPLDIVQRAGTGCGGAVNVTTLQQLPSRSFLKLQTLRKKMSKLRRRSNATDYGKQLREFVSGWNYHQLHSLRQEYEALSVLKELTLQAIVARPSPSTIKMDLGRLFDSGWCSDIRISYRNEIFEVHRSILSSRCPFFRSRFNSWLARPDVTNNASLPHGGNVGGPPTPPFYTCTSGSSYSLPRDFTPAAMPIEMDDDDGIVDIHMFTCLLRYLYTGSMSLEEARLENWETLVVLCERFGMPNPLDYDLRKMADVVSTNGCSLGDTDCVLVFTDTTLHQSFAPPPCEHRQQQKHYQPSHAFLLQHHHQQPPFELHCHRAILASRSKFFRSVILRRSVCPGDAGDPLGAGSQLFPASNSIRLVLDEGIIPRRLARVLLNCLYTDQLDLSLVLPVTSPCWRDRSESGFNTTERGSPASQAVYLPMSSSNYMTSPQHYQSSEFSPGSSNPHQQHQGARLYHTHTGPVQVSTDTGVASCSACLHDLMELYHIGQFIDFSILCHNCENLLVKSLCVETVVIIMRWSGQAHGSSYVHRQASHYLREDFLAVAHSPTLYELNRIELADCMASSFLQARESDVLSAVIRWGEYQLVRQMEEIDPQGLISQSSANHCNTHTSSKKVIKRKDLNDTELSILISDLIPLVRLEQVLPASSDQVHSAIRRSLIQNPPALYMLATSQQATGDRVASWCRSPAVKPRLQVGGVTVTAYDAASCSPASLHKTTFSHHNSFNTFQPPRLFTPFYDEIRSLLVEQFKVCKSWLDPPGVFSPRVPLRQPLDLLPATSPNQTAPALDSKLLKTVRKRARHLEQLLIVQRALLLACLDRSQVYRQLQLRALREAGLPDDATSIIFVTGIINPPGWVSPGHRCSGNKRHQLRKTTMKRGDCGPPFPSPPSPVASHSSLYSSPDEMEPCEEACLPKPSNQLLTAESLRHSMIGRSIPRQPPDVTCGNSSSVLARKGTSSAVRGPLDLGVGRILPLPSSYNHHLNDSASPRSGHHLSSPLRTLHNSQYSDTEEYEENSLFV